MEKPEGIKKLTRNRSLYSEKRREACDVVGFDAIDKLEKAGFVVIDKVLLLGIRDLAHSSERYINLTMDEVGKPEPPPIDENAPWFVGED